MKPAAIQRVLRGVLLCGALWAAVCADGAQAGDPPIQRPGDDPEIARMVVQALKTDDPEQKLKIYEKILDKDPGNANALQGYRESRAAVEQKRAAEQDRKKKADEDRARQGRGQSALIAAERAFIARDFMGARQKLNEAKSLGQSGSNFTRVERLIAGAESTRSLRSKLWMGAGGVVLAGLVLWIVSFFRRGQAYLELAPADGSRGRRYPVDKDVLTVGAVPEWQGDPIDIVAPDPEKVISRLHCAIHRKGRDYYVVDHSSNGTLLDGRLIPRRLLIPLKRGSRIQLGSDFTLKFGFERRKR